jgi:Lactate racemase N-terminal domain
VQVLAVPDDAVVLVPPPPRDAISDVGAAVREALRYPLSGRPLRGLANRGGRATIVVEPPALPIPGSELDPRRRAIDAASAELEQAGIPRERQTLLVAGGLARRVEARETGGLVTPGFARRFTGRVVVHDVEDPELVELSPGMRVNPALVEADVVVVVTAAQTFLHGGPAALLAAAGVEAIRAAEAESLLETRNSRGWRLALELERLVERRTGLIGVSLALDHPRLDAAVQGYPYDPEALERVARSPLRRLFSLLPGPVRLRLLHSLRVDLTVSTAYAGRPSVAHVEALLRSIESRSAALEAPVETIVVAVPRTTPYLPRERPNPVLAANLALGHALRLWRDSFPVAEGGTAILVHRFHRAFAHPTQTPYRAFFAATRLAREPEVLAAAEREARVDERALAQYRSGRSCHPALPFADWDACQPALQRLGTVLVANCRDATAARQLGFVPAGSISAALELAAGTLGRQPRLGVLVTPPFFPIRVGPTAA